jgi:hypothetical protein
MWVRSLSYYKRQAGFDASDLFEELEVDYYSVSEIL